MQASRLLGSTAPSATVLIRVMVGWVFMSEGIQKFLFPAALGAGRFARIGIPAPQFFGPFVGFWAMMHEARTDFCMLLGLIFLLIVGSGTLSFDDRLSRQPDRHV